MYSNLLDSILENQGNGPRVVSENHDVTSIDVREGLRDAAEMGKQARAALATALGRAATEVEYETEIERLITEQRPQLVEAALRRASLDTTNGRVNVVVAGKPAWHGLGTVMGGVFDADTAMSKGGLHYTVDKVPAKFLWNGELRESTQNYLLIRGDTGRELSQKSVGSRYNVIQNQDSLSVIAGVLASEGEVEYVAAGALRGGEQAFLVASLRKHKFTLSHNGGTIEPYLALCNPHDGVSGQAWIFPTAQRIECANTQRIALQGKTKGIGIRHTGNPHARIADAQHALGLSVKGFQDYQEAAEEMVRTPVPDSIAGEYFDGLLDHICDVSAAQMRIGTDVLAAAIETTVANRELAAKRIERQKEFRADLLNQLVSTYHDPRESAIEGTAWGLLNSATRVSDHGKTSRRQARDETLRAERRFESSLIGDGDDLKQLAYVQAMALASSRN